MKHYLLLLCFLCSCLTLEAKEPSRLRIGFETGVAAIMGDIDDRWEFRKTRDNYYDYDYYYGDQEAITGGEMLYAGLKAELPLKKRMTISSGLRYIHINERISSRDNSHLYLFHPSQQGIELFRINQMNESLGYFSIPLEADIALFGKIHRWYGYVKLGVQAGMKVYEKANLDFVSKEMEQYESEILTTAGDAPSNFVSSIYGAFGFRFIFDSQLRLALEHNFPHLFLTKNSFSLFTPEALPGLQLMVTVPVNFFSSN